MQTLKPWTFGLVIGLAVGLWFGTNIGKGRKFYANPFNQASIGEVMREKSADIVEKSGEVLEKGGQALEQKGESLRPNPNQ
jgi:hypothetical protein